MCMHMSPHGRMRCVPPSRDGAPFFSTFQGAQGRPDILLEWNYYQAPEQHQPPPMALLSTAGELIDAALRGGLKQEGADGEGEGAEGGAFCFPREYALRSVLGLGYRASDDMAWHTDMAGEEGWSGLS